ncbi:MAG: D-alanine--D-alanine ligase [Candidatus Omnitrophota bacterium]
MPPKRKIASSLKKSMNDDQSSIGHIGVLMGGYSSEREISLKSGKAIFAALKECGCWVSDLDIRAKNHQAIKTLIRKSGINVAFIALHGKLGEDGTIQSILEDLKIPYTGSGPRASGQALNKIISQEIFQKHQIPIAPFWVAHQNQKRKISSMIEELREFPVVVKPAMEGSSIGISFADNSRDLRKALKLAFQFGPDVLVERLIEGREMTVGILNEEALPVIEIKPKRSFFDFTAKYQEGMTEYIVPAEIPQNLSDQLKRLALRAHQALGCRDFSRVDMMVDEQQQPFVLEVNTIPGFTSTSLLPKAAKIQGFSFTQLCLKLIDLAHEKKK